MLKRLCLSLVLLVLVAGGYGAHGFATAPAAHAATGGGIISAKECEKLNGVVVSNALDTNNKVADNCIGADKGSTPQNPIYALLAVFIKFLSYLVGTVAVLMIVIAGLQYVISGTSPDNAKQAKNRIERAITGLVLFIIMYGILITIVPKITCSDGSQINYLQHCPATTP